MSYYKPYPSYKNSGVEWLGEVPENWDIRPFWACYSRDKKTGFPNEELLSVYREYGVIRKDSRDDNHNVSSEDLTPYQLVEEGQLVTNKMKTWQGSIAVSKLRGIVSPAYFVFSPKFEHDPDFVHHLFRSLPYISGYISSSKGVRVGQWDLEIEQFRLFPVLCPEIKEQKAISTFIDRETTRINTLIQKKTRFIELLKEKRQAVITHAVTKGLDSNVKMKDSGVEWLGEVPEGWGIFDFWTIATAKSILTDEPIELLSVYLDRGVIPYSEGGGLVHKPAESLEKYQLVEEGYFVMNNQQAWRGSVGVSNYRGLVSPAYLVFSLDERKIHSGFAAYCFKDRFYVDQFMLSSLSVGTIQRQIKWPHLKKVKIVLPSTEEQKRIFPFLDRETTRIDTLIDKTTRSIDLLKERRSALITASVTGKVDVRGEVAT